MVKYCKLVYKGETIAESLRYCDSFFSRGLGLMFRKGSAVLVDNKETTAAIHMLFVFQALDIVWLDKKKRIVDIKTNVQPFTLHHAPKKKAQYVLELPQGTASHLEEGQKISIIVK